MMEAGTRYRIFVPCDSAAVAAGADEVATALQLEFARRTLDVEIVRNGSRGLFWLEPMVEVETPAGRVAYGPVDVADVAGLLDAGLLEGGAHVLHHGLTEAIPFLAKQELEKLSADNVAIDNEDVPNFCLAVRL